MMQESDCWYFDDGPLLAYQSFDFDYPPSADTPDDLVSSPPTMRKQPTRSEIYGTREEARRQKKLFGSINLKTNETFRELRGVGCKSKGQLEVLAKDVAGHRRIPRDNKRSIPGLVAFLQGLVEDRDYPEITTIEDIVRHWRGMSKRR